MKNNLFVFSILIICIGFVTAENVTNETNISNSTNVTEQENLSQTIDNILNNSIEEVGKIVSYDWFVSNEAGANVIYFENVKELQTKYLNVISDSKRRINVECKPNGEQNDLCPYLTYDQNFILEKSENIVQKYKIDLYLYDSNKYSSQLIFTDENNVSMKIIVYALPKSEFDFDGTIEIFGGRFYASEIAILISAIIVGIIGLTITLKLWKLIFLVILWVALSFIIYIIISLF